MSRRDAIDSLFLKKPVSPEKPASEKYSVRVRTGAISAMGTSLQEMADSARAAARLQDQLAEGQAVILLDPESIDGSSIADRLSVEVDPTFDQLVESIGENGQQVPILVRPHPDAVGRYQIAYGRRRLRAAEKLGQKVRAIVQVLSDTELVVAQGRENLDRADLSFIEKALFARRLDDAGYERMTITAALATDKADVSRYISVARSIPESLIARIGPARKSGRARWVALAEVVARPRIFTAIEEAMNTEAFLTADSDTRFAIVFRIATTQRKSAAPKPGSWNTPSGKRGARIQKGNGKISVIFDERQVPEFGNFVAAQLDELYARFLETGRGGKIKE